MLLPVVEGSSVSLSFLSLFFSFPRSSDDFFILYNDSINNNGTLRNSNCVPRQNKINCNNELLLSFSLTLSYVFCNNEKTQTKITDLAVLILLLI